MYKTISINNSTYQQLQALARKLQKPKSQVIDDLVKEYIDRMHEDEKNSLKDFNAAIKNLAKKVKLPKDTKITAQELNDAFLTFMSVQSVDKLK